MASAFRVFDLFLSGWLHAPRWGWEEQEAVKFGSEVCLKVFSQTETEKSYRGASKSVQVCRRTEDERVVLKSP